MQPHHQLLRILADGRFHSGAVMGKALNLSRSAIWKHLQSLAEWGIELHSVPGKGYRLPDPLELLDSDTILGHMNEDARMLVPSLEIHHDIDSTNRHLMQKGRLGAVSGQACLAERQRAGRGRHGRPWVSPFGVNIYLSLSWRFTAGPESLSGLTLATGIAVVRALTDAGLEGAGLKWPNDVLWQGRKLAGILLEMTGELSGACHVVAGIGLNVRMPRHLAAGIDQPWVDVETALNRPASRNQLAGRLLQHLVIAMREFESAGFPAFQREWAMLDLAYGRQVALQLPSETVTGIGRGIDASGALILEDNGLLKQYPYGEVSLRMIS